MAETRTPRMGLPQWSDINGDAPSMSDFNEAFTQIETNAAMDLQGTASARPSAGKRGRYYFATDTLELSRDTGSSWVSIGRTVTGTTTSTPGSANTVAGIFKAAVGQTAALTQWQNSSGSQIAVVDSDGDAAFKSVSGNSLFAGSGGISTDGTLQVEGQTNVNALTASGRVNAQAGIDAAASNFSGLLKANAGFQANTATVTGSATAGSLNLGTKTMNDFNFNKTTVTTTGGTGEGNVNHGLGQTPDAVLLTVAAAGGNRMRASCVDVTATYFRVELRISSTNALAPNGTYNVYWLALT